MKQQRRSNPIFNKERDMRKQQRMRNRQHDPGNAQGHSIHDATAALIAAFGFVRIPVHPVARSNSIRSAIPDYPVTLR